jgi:hypothetical protein
MHISFFINFLALRAWGKELFMRFLKPTVATTALGFYLFVAYFFLTRAEIEHLATYALVFLIPFLVAIRLGFRDGWSLAVSNAVTLGVSIAMCLGITELTLRQFMDVMPLAVQRGFTTTNVSRARTEMVDFLPQSPFVKFKPNTKVQSQGYLGPGGEFKYEWKTDGLGFKNKPSLANTPGGVVSVAVGDSFTEGMGVAVSETWAALLSEAGVPTYSMGVQGYTPTQASGAFDMFGHLFHPKVVFIGYSGGAFTNATRYADREAVNDAIRSRKFLGGIQHFVERQADRKHRLALSALLAPAIPKGSLDWLWSTTFQSNAWLYETKGEELSLNPKQGTFQPEILQVPEIARLYLPETMRYAETQLDIDSLKNSRAMKVTLDAYRRIKNAASKSGATTALIYFPHRGILYYEVFGHRDLPANSVYKNDRVILEEFCKAEGIEFIDMTSPVKKYLLKIGPDATKQEFPYFVYDGHFNHIGNYLVAQRLSEYLHSQLGLKLELGTKPISSKDLTVVNSSGVGSHLMVLASEPLKSGRRYWEVAVPNLSADPKVAATAVVGIAPKNRPKNQELGQGDGEAGWRGDAVLIRKGETRPYGTAWSAVDAGDTRNLKADRVMVAVDIDKGKLWFGLNGNWLSDGDPERAVNPSIEGLKPPFAPAVSSRHGETGTAVIQILRDPENWRYKPPKGFNPVD